MSTQMKYGKMTMNIRIASLILLSLSLLAGFTASAQAQSPTPMPAFGPVPVTDDMVNAVAKTLYCPVCENIPLDVCPTQACSQWRDLIKLKLSQGWTTEQIREYFAQIYGDRVLSAPPPEGLNLLVYILPPAFFLVGVFILYRVLRSRQKPAPAVVSPPEGETEDPYLKRLEEEIKRQQ